jgi:two-component system NtrC family sensor kinase
MRFHFSLITKLILSTSLTLLGFMGLLAYTNTRNFHDAIIEYAVSNAEQLAEIINQGAYVSMMENDKGSLFEMIRNIGQSEGIRHINLIDRTGKIVYSSIKDDIGKIVDKNAEACTMCHKSDNPRLHASSMRRSRFFTDTEGHAVMGFTKAIYNEPACFNASCHFHTSDYTILGVLDIVISLDKLNHKISDYRTQFLVITCVLILLTGILITFLTQLFVNRPVQRLVQHSALVSEGNFNARVPVTSHDELGELSEAVNDMTEHLGRARQELEAWGASLEMKIDERTQEIKKIETHLFRSEKLASLGKLVAGIAHEINNPLTGVLLYSSIVDADKRLHEELKPDVERIITEGRRCADIVSRLLEFSREAMPHKEAVCLNELLEQVIALIHLQPSFHNIVIVKEYASSLPSVLIDPRQLQQVFVNLFINASQAMEEGGTLTITTRLDDEGFLACADVMDTGCGMLEEDFGRIFDPFYTTKSGGTGLGLSISYGIVENNGGKIEVKSTFGCGTVFTVKLPVFVG